MKQAVKKLLYTSIPVVLIMLAAFLLLFPKISTAGIQKGLNVCVTAVLTSLFPFFVISDLCCTWGYAEKIASAALPITGRLFHIKEQGSAVFVLGILGGYPVGAKSALEMYRTGKISQNECHRLLLFCNNAGPSFIIGFVGAGLFQNVMVGIVLYVIHILSACILGIYHRQELAYTATKSLPDGRTKSIAPSITEAIKKAGQTSVHVCIFILFFSILNEYLNNFLPQSFQKFLPVKLLTSSLELAGGLTSIAPQITEGAMVGVSAFLLGWGGLCVNFQTLALLDKTDISGKGYLASKLLHGCISTILSVPFIIVLDNTALHFIRNKMVVIAFAGLIAFSGIIFLKKSTGKHTDNAI